MHTNFNPAGTAMGDRYDADQIQQIVNREIEARTDFSISLPPYSLALLVIPPV